MPTLVEAIKNFQSGRALMPKTIDINNALSWDNVQNTSVNMGLDRFIGQPFTDMTMVHIAKEVGRYVKNYCEQRAIPLRRPPGWTVPVPPGHYTQVAHDLNVDYFARADNRVKLDVGENSWVTDFRVLRNENRVEINLRSATLQPIPGFNQSEIMLSDISDLCTNEEYYERSVKEVVKNRIKSNLLIKVKSRSEPLSLNPQEATALECLREMVSEYEYRRYIKDGFILVRGESDKVYQIFRNKSHTKVWHQGRVIEEVCVRISTDANVPSTDQVIAFMTMIKVNEEEFKKHGNVYNLTKAA